MIAPHDRAHSPRATLRVPSRSLVAVLGGLLLTLALLAATTDSAAAQDAHDTTDDAAERIVSVAMRSLGQNEGECFPWVRRVIAEATGVSMGYGYHEGYLEGGAVEIPLAEAQRGDVIQIADPDDNGPGVDYPGLHTAIVMYSHGDGTFDVIDSNSQWDGIVRMREAYDPLWAANRYDNLAVRAYRFSNVEPGTMLAVDSPSLLVSTDEIAAGEQARIATDTGGCLNFRETPSTSGNIIRCLADGLFVNVLDGTAEANGYLWREVEVGGDVGWVVDVYLTGVEEAETTSETETAAEDDEDEADETDETAEEDDDAVEEETAAIGQFVSGGLPPNGGVALVIWGGGSVDLLHTNATEGGCNLLSLWSTADGGLIGHIIGAPDFVNARWVEAFPGDLPEDTPLLAVCARPGDDGGFAPPTSPPDGVFIEGEGPPGPAGNE